MKKILYITSAVLALLAVSCTKVEVSDNGHEPGPKDVDGCYGVYFPTQEASGAHTYDPLQEPKVEITVARKDRKGEITVPFKIVSETPDVFTAGDIKFANGDSLTTVVVDFPNSELGKNYSFTLKVDDPQYVSYYGGHPTSIDFSVMRVEYKYVLNPKTNEPAWFSYTDDWYKLDHKAKIKYYEVDGVRYCETETEPYVEGGVEYPGFFSDGFEVTFEWYKNGAMEDPQGKIVQPFHINYVPVAYEPDYQANLMMTDYYSYWTIVNPQAALAGVSFIDFVKKYATSYPISYYDGNGGFYFYTHQYHLEGTNLAAGVDDYNVIMIGEGFTRTDFEVKKIVPDYTQEGVVPVSVKTGRDAKALKYVTVEGELTATQAGKIVDAIADGTQEGVQESTKFFYDETEDANWFDFGFTFEKTGFYSIVAVVLNEGKVAGSGSASFFYVAADDDTYEVKVAAALEETPARFQDFDRTSSLGFYIVGKEITDLKFNLYKSSDVASKGLDNIVNALRKDESADDTVIEAVNSLGGFTGVFSELSALTDYTLVVWASNGAKTKVVTSQFKTEGLPNEVICTGTYNGGARLFGEDYPAETTLEYNPNTGTYEIPNFLDSETKAPLYFTIEDDVLSVLPSYTGYDYAAGAPIYVYEGSDVYDLTKYGLAADAHSYYDKDAGCYYFCTAYYVPALRGGFGVQYETFKVDADGVVAIANSVRTVSATASGKNCKSDVAVPSFQPKVNVISYVREPKAVDSKVVYLSHKSAPKKDAPKKVRKFDATSIK